MGKFWGAEEVFISLPDVGNKFLAHQKRSIPCIQPYLTAGSAVVTVGKKKVVFYWICNFKVHSGLVFWSELWYKYEFINS